MMRISSERKTTRGFTLIELLIVVAIIAILAAIAVPNFLEAQVRAKVSRARADLKTIYTATMTYYVDYNAIYPDSNDSVTPPDLKGLSFEKENPGLYVDLEYRANPSWTGQFYTFRQFRPLTTPIAYITFRPRDPFSKVMPFGLDTREVNSKIVYAVVFSGGPDGFNGDWFRGFSDSKMSIPYNASNGTKSRGDIWKLMTQGGSDHFKQEYGFDY